MYITNNIAIVQDILSMDWKVYITDNTAFVQNIRSIESVHY